MRVVLSAHADLVIPPECGFAIWLYPKYKNKDVSTNSILTKYVQDLLVTKKFETWELEIPELQKFLFSQPPSNYAELVDRIYRFYGLANGIRIKRWGDKNNFYLEYIEELDEILSDAQFIHIVRDGRDVACSYLELTSKKISSKYRPILPDSILEIANEWLKNNHIIEKALDNIDSSRKYVVRHEDLVLDFNKTVHALSDFLRIDYDPAMEQYYAIDKAKEPEEFMQWKQKLYQKPDASTVGRYKNDLTSEQTMLFNEIAGRCLDKYGYQF